MEFNTDECKALHPKKGGQAGLGAGLVHLSCEEIEGDGLVQPGKGTALERPNHSLLPGSPERLCSLHPWHFQDPNE